MDKLRSLVRGGYALAMMALLVACIPVPPVPRSPLATMVPGSTEEAHTMLNQDEVVARAVADLAQRLGVASDQITVREVRAVVWPDGSVGCPQPGTVYEQATESGLLILLQSGNRVYHYHSGESQVPFWCDPRGVFTRATPKVDEFVPPPGSEID